MRCRTPNQLHASLYMDEFSLEKKGTKTIKPVKGKLTKSLKAADVKTVRRKKISL